MIAHIVGARPQFIKASIVTRSLNDLGLEQVLIHTGQHYDYNMSDIFFEELKISESQYSLRIGSGSHGKQTGKMLIEIEKLLFKLKPSIVIVYGDTNTTLAGALASVKLKVKTAHVESGLRSFNKDMPEEINRVVTDHVSDILFAPTKTSVENLENESISQGVYLVGDVMFDIAQSVNEKIRDRQQVILKKYGLKENNFILATIHRAENTDSKEHLKNILNAFFKIASGGVTVFFPIHPRTKKSFRAFGLFNRDIPEQLIIHDPVSYTDMIVLEQNAAVVITDSGGVQKESYFFKTPAIIPRQQTEWVELVDVGWNVLAGNNTDMIVESSLKLFQSGCKRKWHNFYGDGNAADKIGKIIKNYLEDGSGDERQ